MRAKEYLSSIGRGAKLAGEIIILTLPFVFGGCKKETPLESYTYSGEFKGYVVIIEQYGRNGHYERMVHLEAKDITTRPDHVTGHDYDSNGTWERIFIGMTPMDGYSSILFKSDGEQVWEPAGVDKESIQRFAPDKLIQAKKILDEATEEIGTEKHRIE